MKIDNNINVSTPNQTNQKNDINGSFNNRKVQQNNASKNTISQNTIPKKGFEKQLKDFAINVHQVIKTIKTELNLRSVKKQAINSLINNGYTPEAANTITSHIAKAVQSKKEFFANINDYPTAKQYQQGYISKFQVDNDLAKAINDVQQLGYTDENQILVTLQHAQQQSASRDDFLKYVGDMPTTSEAGKGYTSKAQVIADIKRATELLKKSGYEHENIEDFAKKLQGQSFSRDHFVHLMNELSFKHELQPWTENTLIAKGYSKAEATEIFNNLAQQIPDYNNLINVINTMRTKEQASTGTSFNNYSPEEQNKLKQEALEVLKLTKDATPKEISKAYKKLALQYHPDKNPTAKAKEIFIKIQQAYEFLTK